jgi:hypothetical protein
MIRMPEHKEITSEKAVIRLAMGDRLLFFILGFLERGGLKSSASRREHERRRRHYGKPCAFDVKVQKTRFY